MSQVTIVRFIFNADTIEEELAPLCNRHQLAFSVIPTLADYPNVWLSGSREGIEAALVEYVGDQTIARDLFFPDIRGRVPMVPAKTIAQKLADIIDEVEDIRQDADDLDAVAVWQKLGEALGPLKNAQGAAEAHFGAMREFS